MDIQKEEQDLLAQNIALLTAKDVALVSYPGSGSSLLGGIFMNLGIDYIEGYQEQIVPEQHKTITKIPYWREQWSQLSDKYNLHDFSEECLRTIKAHHYPVSFKDSKIKKAILLVRDARDAVISYYHWRKGFSDEKEELHDFICRDGYYNKKPFDDWTAFCTSWKEWGNDHELHVIRYEDIKFNPLQTIQETLRFLGLERSEDQILTSLEKSSFSKVKQQETNALDNKDSPRIFRKGQVGEWMEVLDDKSLSMISSKTYACLEDLSYISHPNRVDENVLTIISDKPIADEFAHDIKIEYAPDKIQVLQDSFLIQHMDSMLAGPCLILSGNAEITKSVSARCALNDWPLIDHKKFYKRYA